MLIHQFTTSPTTWRWLTSYISYYSVTLKDGDTPPQVVGGTTDDWHIYRFTCDDTDWNMYMDNAASPALTLPVETARTDNLPYPGNLAFYWGEGSGVQADLDYVRWTDEGAFLPADSGYSYKQSDFNKDYYVNMEDLSCIANEWLECTDPANAACD